MRLITRKETQLALLFVFALVVLPASGCVGFAANLLYVIKGNTVPARCKALKNQRVAVVCVSNSMPDGPDTATDLMARSIGSELRERVSGIQIVPQSKVDDWRDSNPRTKRLDFVQLGSDVNADFVLAIHVKEYSLHDGATMLKGRTVFDMEVYDVNEDSVVYNDSYPDFEFPKKTGLPVTETSEAVFQKAYLKILAEEVTQHFYDYDAAAPFGSDARALGVGR